MTSAAHSQAWAAAVAGVGSHADLGLAGKLTQAGAEDLGRRLVGAEQQVDVDVAVAFNDHARSLRHRVPPRSTGPTWCGSVTADRRGRIVRPLIAPDSRIALERGTPAHARGERGG